MLLAPPFAHAFLSCLLDFCPSFKTSFQCHLLLEAFSDSFRQLHLPLSQSPLSISKASPKAPPIRAQTMLQVLCSVLHPGCGFDFLWSHEAGLSHMFMRKQRLGEVRSVAYGEQWGEGSPPNCSPALPRTSHSTL